MGSVALDTFGFPTSDRAGTWAFYRSEDRRSSRRRTLTCGHVIDRTEPYLYSVGKLWGAEHLTQTLDCDVCRRAGDRY